MFVYEIVVLNCRYHQLRFEILNVKFGVVLLEVVFFAGLRSEVDGIDDSFIVCCYGRLSCANHCVFIDFGLTPVRFGADFDPIGAVLLRPEMTGFFQNPASS